MGCVKAYQLKISLIKYISRKKKKIMLAWMLASETENQCRLTIPIVWWKIIGYYQSVKFFYKYLLKDSPLTKRENLNKRPTRVCENQNK